MSDEDSRTLFVRNIGSTVTEDILYELFMQAGPLQNVKIPKDKNTGSGQKSFGFVCYKDECSVPYAVYLLDNTRLCGQTIKVQTRRKGDFIPPMNEVGIHSLDPDLKTNNNEGPSDTVEQYGYNGQNNLSASQNTYSIPTQVYGNTPYSSSPQVYGNAPLMGNFPPGFQGYGQRASVDTHNINYFKAAQEQQTQWNYSPAHRQNYHHVQQQHYYQGNNYASQDRHHGYRDNSSNYKRHDFDGGRNNNRRHHERSGSYQGHRNSSHSSNNNYHMKR